MHLKSRGKAVAYLLGVNYVHNDSALQHACQTRLDGKVVLAILGAVAVGGGELSCHCLVWLVTSVFWIQV